MLELIARGLTNDDIARVLGIAQGTVRIHVSATLEALQVANRTEAAAAWFRWRAEVGSVSAVLARPAIAVLPFVALGDAPGECTVAAAIGYDLAALFSRWIRFPVIAWSSSSAPPTPGISAREFGRSLGARFLVSGAIRAGGPSWRLTVNIDDVAENRCLWAEKFDFPRDALFEVQDEVTGNIVATAYDVLEKNLALRVVDMKHPHGLDAWTLAHEGILLQGVRAPGSNVRAKERFAAALERDSHLVLARFGQGLCFYDDALNQWGGEGASEGLLSSARACIDLAPHAAEGYFLLGRYHQTRGQHTQAVAPLELAVARNPSAAAAQALLAQVLVLAGRPEEGLVRMQHAMRLAPRSYVAGLASFHYLRGDDAAALEHAEAALDTNPGYPFGRVIAAASAWGLGDRARAEAHARALRSQHPGFSPTAFLARFGGGFPAIDRIARALSALGVED